MKKKLTRNAAISLHGALSAIAIGSLDQNTLDVVVDNSNIFRKVAEDFEALKKELSERLYKDVDKDLHKNFSEVAKKYETAREIEKRDELYKVMETYTEIYPLYEKHIKALASLLGREIEIEIKEENADYFIKGVCKGLKDASLHEIRAVFEPLFKEEKKEATDLSELDEILK
jgi:hypothetical protein